MANKKILLALTTTSGSDWRGKISEINKFGIKELALFPTSINMEERKEFYALLEKTGVEDIPHVHLRNDMELWELDYLVERYNTQVFNIHSSNGQYPLMHNLSAYREKIYVENSVALPTVEDLNNYAGLCLDVSHFEDDIRKKADNCDNSVDAFRDMLDRYPVGCAHVSAVCAEAYLSPDKNYPGRMEYSNHWMGDLSELDYVKKHLEYLPDIISIELENSFEEQLKAKEYLEKIINQ